MRYKILTIAISSVLAFSACSSASNSTNSAPVSNGDSSTTVASNTANSAAPASESASALPSISPTDVFKSQTVAQKKRDVQAMKQNLSKRTLEMMEQGAKERKKSVDELLAEQNPATANAPDTFEMRNEKIEGDTASIEVFDPNLKQWSTIPFVKEEGRWKIALDKFIEEAYKKIQEQQNSASQDGHNH